MSHTTVPEITLRAPEPDDINIIYIWENLTDEAHSSLRTGPLSRHRIAEFVNNYDGEIYTSGGIRYMICMGNETVGTVDVFDYEPRGRHAFVGIFIAPGMRRKGIGALALRRVAELMKNNVDMYSLAALIAEDNTASQRLFESVGYERVGTLHGWLSDRVTRLNAFLYQKVL